MTKYLAALFAIISTAALAQPSVQPGPGPVPALWYPQLLSKMALRASADNPQSNPPMMVPAWALSSVFGSGEIVGYNNGSTTLYFEQHQGPYCTSASSGSGPTTATAAGTFITDGTCLWGSTSVTPTGNAPTITTALSYNSNATAFPANTLTATTSGSGSTQVVNFYTSSGGTTAPQGSAAQATFSGSVMSVTSCSPCTFAPGQTLFFAGKTGAPVIQSQVSGTTGGIGTYNLSVGQGTIGSAVSVTTYPFGPTGTGTFSDGTVTWTFTKSIPIGKNYTWSGGAGTLPNVVNMYGGTPTGTGSAVQMYAATVNGSFSPSSLQRYELITNSPQLVVETYEGGTGINSARRFIVCGPTGTNCHFVSPNRIGIPTAGGFYYTLLDFTAVGGRSARDIIIEEGPGVFQGVYGSVGDDFYSPDSSTVLTMVDAGDSYPNGNGVMYPMWSYPQIAADQLGIRNVVNTAIGGCGYAAALCSSGSLIGRLSDVAKANNGSPPDIVLLSNGTNDNSASESPATIAAYQTAYIQAIRTTSGLATVPIFVMGIYAHNSGGTSCSTCVAVEQAEQAAIAAMNDPNTFFCPWTTDPAGAWETGTGSVAAQNTTGNADYQFNGAGNGHDNAYANRQFAARLVKCIRKYIISSHY